MAYGRGLFPENFFKTQDINGLRLKTLGGKASSEQSKLFSDWVEDGVFDALNQGFLERCVLVVSDEQGRTIEGWSLSVRYTTDKDGNERADLVTNGPDGREYGQSVPRRGATKSAVKRSVRIQHSLASHTPRVASPLTRARVVCGADDAHDAGTADPDVAASHGARAPLALDARPLP